jgi:hypothetical protein
VSATTSVPWWRITAAVRSVRAAETWAASSSVPNGAYSATATRPPKIAVW